MGACQSSTSQEPLVSGDGDWVRGMKEEAGKWNGNKLVVLSLFDGIGGVWAALTRLGIPFRGYSSEVVSNLQSWIGSVATSLGIKKHFGCSELVHNLG